MPQLSAHRKLQTLRIVASNRTLLLVALTLVGLWLSARSDLAHSVRWPDGDSPVAAASPQVAFEATAATGIESSPTVALVVKLSAAVNMTVTVQFGVTGGTASATSVGSGQDYALVGSTLTFEPGSTEQKITLSIFNDALNEADETLELSLLNAEHATLGQQRVYTYTIVDNDRASLVNVVTDFHAKGDGVTNDTQAIQQAIDAVAARGGGVVFFPARVYLVTTVTLYENITYEGYGATIKRPPMQGNWTRTFDTGNKPYRGAHDSRPLIIKGLTFDGNSQAQGPYKAYELEQAHLIFLTGDATLPGRLQVIIEDCVLQNNVADGVSVYTNVAIKLYNCKSSNVFRGAFVLTGGYSSAMVTKLTTTGTIDTTGIDIEVDGQGFGGTYRVDVQLEDLRLLDGDFDIAVQDGSTVIGNNIIADAPFYLFGKDSRLHFTNSTFKVGAADSFSNRIVLPHNITFEHCTFYVTRKETGEPYTFFAVADIWWQLVATPIQRNQTLSFIDCRFLVDSTIKAQDRSYIIYSRWDVKNSQNSLVIRTSCTDGRFDREIVTETNSPSSLAALKKCKATA